MDSELGFANGDAEGTEKEQKVMKAVTSNLIDGLSTHLSSGEVFQHDAGSLAVQKQSVDHSNPGQGSDTGTPQGHLSPIFLSDRFTPEQTHTEEALDGSPHRRGIAVVVPPLERRWEYRVYKDKTTIDKVLNDSRKSGQLQYLVKFIDAQELLVSNASSHFIKAAIRLYQYVFLQPLRVTLPSSTLITATADNIRAPKPITRWIEIH